MAFLIIFSSENIQFSSVAQLCTTICNPMNCSTPGSSVHGIFRQVHWSKLPFPTSGDLPNPGLADGSPALADGFFTTEPPGYNNSTFSSVQSLSCVRLFATAWTAACQTSLSITNSRSLLKLMSIESVMPSKFNIE